MKPIQKSILYGIFFLAFSACAKAIDPKVEPCQTCTHSNQDGMVRIEVCPETLTYYEDGVYTTTLPHGGSVADFVESHTYGGFTCN